jgi:GNAT superfamily N-acetyltransferase
LFDCGEAALDKYFSNSGNTGYSLQHRSSQWRGLGEAMLADAAARAAGADAAAFTLLVDANSDSAVAFYHRYGFRLIVGQSRSIFLPVATAQDVFLQKNTH